MDQDDNSPWQYKPDGDKAPQKSTDANAQSNETDDDQTSTPKPRSAKSVSWEADEYIDHTHGPLWFLALIVSTSLAAVVVYLISKDLFASIIIAIVGIIIGVFASHTPGKAKYEISDDGLRLNDKLYRYADFKSFTIFHEGKVSSVNLLPLKRFVTPVTAYFEPADEKKIVNALGNYLPYEDRQPDAVDRLSRRLRL
jgi:hypothetical protein